MGIWLMMLAANVLIPLTMMVLGRRFQTRPPKTINPVFGYRTRRSMQNQDTWGVAHRYCGKLWVRWGGITLAVTGVAMGCLWGQTAEVTCAAGGIVCGIQLLVLLGSLVPTERALKQTFDDRGRRRQGGERG